MPVLQFKDKTAVENYGYSHRGHGTLLNANSSLACLLKHFSHPLEK